MSSADARLKHQQDIFTEKDKILDFGIFILTTTTVAERFYTIKTGNEVLMHLTHSDGRKLIMFLKFRKADWPLGF